MKTEAYRRRYLAELSQLSNKLDEVFVKDQVGVTQQIAALGLACGMRLSQVEHPNYEEFTDWLRQCISIGAIYGEKFGFDDIAVQGIADG